MSRKQAPNNPTLLMAAIVLLIAAVFALDLLLPLGVADGVLYVAPVAISLWLPGRRITAHVAVSCAILTALGFLLSPPGSELLEYVLLNRAYSLFAIGMMVLVDMLQRRLVKQNDELVSQATRLEALYEIGTGLSALLDVTTIKETAVQRARQLFASDAAGLALLGADSTEVRWRLLVGAAREDFTGVSLPLGQGLVGKAIQSGQPMVVEDAQVELGSEEMTAMNAFLAQASLRAALVVPVQIAGKPIGALMVGYHAPRAFDLNDVKLLTGLANQVAASINNAQLKEQLRALSALEERQRLAREMHDGLAQVLGSVTARATAAGMLLAQGKVLDAQGQLGHLQEAAQKAYVDVRRAIWGLRAPSSKSRGLLEALNEYVRRVNEQGEISVQIESGEGAHLHDPAPAIEVQAIRIIQEALTNVRKHSRARTACIDLREDDRWLTITIRDDGEGFDLADARDTQGHFGLDVMRERAESVGGRLSLDTAPGKGTALTVQLPVEMEG